MAVPAAVIASAIGAGASATIDPLVAGLSSWMGNYSNKKAQKRAYNYYKRSLKEGPLLQRQGLEAAGYNPMLALGSIGGSPFSANSNPTPVPIGDVVGSAAQGAKLGNDIAEGIKLENEKKRLENKNLLSDLDTKEVQRLQMEANESLIRSQTERSDLAYGVDIANAVGNAVSTGASVYSAKQMADVAKRNVTVNEKNLDYGSTTTIRDKNGKVVGIRDHARTAEGFSHVDPMSKSTPKSKPNAGGLGHSAKSVGRIAGRIAKELLMLSPVALPFAPVVTEKGRNSYNDTFKRERQIRKRSKVSPLGF